MSKPYPVDARGIGFPDFQPVATKAVEGANQISWYAVQEGAVPGLKAVDWINYEVPKSPPTCTLRVCSGLVSCNQDEIHRVALNFSPALLGTISYKQLLVLPLNPSASYAVPAGSLLYVRVYNDNAAERYFCVSLVGFLEVVG